MFNRLAYFNRTPFNRIMGAGVIHYPDEIHAISEIELEVEDESGFQNSMALVSQVFPEVGGESPLSIPIEATSSLYPSGFVRQSIVHPEILVASGIQRRLLVNGQSPVGGVAKAASSISPQVSDNSPSEKELAKNSAIRLTIRDLSKVS